MLQTLGVYYPAIIVKDMDESIMFYRRLGMQLLYKEPNRDDPESVIAMLATGDASTMLQLVGPTHGEVEIAEGALGVGSMQYLTFHVSREQMDAMFSELSSAGVHGSEVIDRGYERLVFMEDPNGVLVVLIVWATEPPPGMSRGAVLARAGQIRDAAGDTYVEDVHVQQAIADLAAVR